MHLSPNDILAALGQLAASTSNEIHRAALKEAMGAYQFRAAVESAMARHSRDQGATLAPKHPGAPWDAEEDLLLRASFEAGKSLDAIAARHGREPLEVAVRLHRPLGLLTEQAVDEIRSARARAKPTREMAMACQALAGAAFATAPAVATQSQRPAPEAAADAPTSVVADAAPSAREVVVAEPVTAVPPQQPVVAEAAARVAGAAPVAASGAEGRPEMSEDEEKAVTSVISRWSAKGAPKAALKQYIDSDKFAVKVTPEILEWLNAQLARMG